MTTRLHRSFAALLLIFLAAMHARAADSAPAIDVKGAVEKPAKWTADSLGNQFASEVKSIDYTSCGQQHKATGIPLYSVLHEAGADAQMKMGPDVSPAMKNHALRLAVVVTSVDGYTAAFSLAELLPDMGNTAAYIAFDLDGRPFQEGEGHLRVIVTTDKKPARSVRDVQTINVVDVSK